MKSCKHCGKNYTRTSSLERHVLICELLYKSEREKKCIMEESTDIPSILQLYKIIQELLVRQRQLEEKINKMHTTKMSKLNVLDWLNKQVIPEITFQEWTNNIQVEDTDVQKLFEREKEKDMEQIMIGILNRHIKPQTPSQHQSQHQSQSQQKTHQTQTHRTNPNPIFCFLQKTNVLYIYTTDKWKKMQAEDFSFLLKGIDKKLFKGIYDWKKENNKKMQGDEQLEDLFNKAVIKITSTSYNTDSICLSKIRNQLYNKLKMDLSVIEMGYEFE